MKICYQNMNKWLTEKLTRPLGLHHVETPIPVRSRKLSNVDRDQYQIGDRLEYQMLYVSWDVMVV